MLEDLVKYLIEKLGDKSAMKLSEISFPFKKITFSQFIKDKSGLDFDKDSLNEFQKYLKDKQIEFGEGESKAKLADLIVKQFRGGLINPTYIIDDPLELSPLAKQDLNDLEHTLRFHLYIGGKEVCNGFSELNDAMEQRKRFEEQEDMHKSGDKDAHPLDTDFVDALEYGMPPTGGVGIGIERLISVLLGKNSLKEVLFFPFLKNKE
jgi:lysyl-tRNA synthetase class 2